MLNARPWRVPWPLKRHPVRKYQDRRTRGTAAANSRLRRQGGGGGGSTGPAITYTSNYLPNVGTAPKTWGMKANADATIKNLFRVVKNDNSASLVIQNVGAPNTRPDLPNYAALATFIGAAWSAGLGVWTGTTTCKVDLVYEQGGSGVDFYQTTHANRPAIDLNQRFNDVVYLLFDGQCAWGVGSGNAVLKYLRCTGSFSIANGSMFWCADPLNSYINNTFVTFLDAVPNVVMTAYLDGQFSAGNLKGSGLGTCRVPRSQPTVIGYTNDVNTTCNWWVNDTEVAGAFPQNFTAVDIYLAYNPNGSAVWGGTGDLGYGRYRFLGFTYYPATLSQANARSVHDAHITMFNLGHTTRAWVGGDTTTFTKRDVYLGDSITYGFKSEPAYSVTAALHDRGVLANREFFNVALSGDTCSGQNNGTNYNARVAPLFTSSYGAGNCRLVIQTGVNDIAQGGTQAALATNRSGINTLAAATGFRVGTCSLLPTTVNGTTWTAGMEAIRTAFNGGGANTYTSTGNFGIDVATNANLQNTTDVTKYPDGLHLALFGQQLVAPTYEAATA